MANAKGVLIYVRIIADNVFLVSAYFYGKKAQVSPSEYFQPQKPIRNQINSLFDTINIFSGKRPAPSKAKSTLCDLLHNSNISLPILSLLMASQDKRIGCTIEQTSRCLRAKAVQVL